MVHRPIDLYRSPLWKALQPFYTNFQVPGVVLHLVVSPVHAAFLYLNATTNCKPITRHQLVMANVNHLPTVITTVRVQEVRFTAFELE
jgi:hypothetical protein